MSMKHSAITYLIDLLLTVDMINSSAEGSTVSIGTNNGWTYLSTTRAQRALTSVQTISAFTHPLLTLPLPRGGGSS